MIGIFGGTFDPIHYGHLRIALDVLENLDLERIHFVPLQTAVHREQPSARPVQRLAMLQASLQAESRFLADDRELQRGGRSYTLDTLESFRAELGTEKPLCLLVGSDAFNNFMSWHQPTQVADLAHVIVMQRPGYQLPDDPALRRLVEPRRTNLQSDLASSPGRHICFRSVTQLDISSTNIRRRLSRGLSARYLTPDAVLEYIAANGLYGCKIEF